MREFLGPVQAAKVQTELGTIYVMPGRNMRIHAPHLTVDDGPCKLLPTFRATVSPQHSIWFRLGTRRNENK